MFLEPGFDLGMPVRTVVVHDQVQGFPARKFAIHAAQKLQEFLMPVPLVEIADDLALQQVEGGEKRGGAVALIVVGHGAAASRLQRQAGLGAV